MNSQQFVQWLRGFTEGVHEFNVTPAKWDLLKDTLSKVNDGAPITSITPAKEGFGYYYVSSTNSINPKKEMLND